MKNQNIVSLFQPDMTTVVVSLTSTGFYQHATGQKDITPKGDNQYIFKVKKSWCVKAGELVVVPHNDHLMVGVVTQVHDEPDIDYNSDSFYAWIIQRVNMDDFIRAHESEKEFMRVLNASEKKRIREQMVAELKESIPEIENAAMALHLDN